MDSQPDKNTKYLILFVTILISLCLVEFTLSTANGLRERRFPEDFSILAGLYPNYLLFGGGFIFLVVGFLTVKFAFDKYDVNKAPLIVLSGITTLTILLVLLGNRLTYLKDMLWHNERSQIILVWVVAYWTGNVWMYSYFHLKKLWIKK